MRPPRGDAGAGGGASDLSAGRSRPSTTTTATSASASGSAAPRSSSCSQGCCHSGSGSGSTSAGVRNGAEITRTESPRSRLKPMLSWTSAVSLSISSCGRACVVSRPRASVVLRWLTTTAALTRRTVPVAARVTRTVLSTS